MKRSKRRVFRNKWALYDYYMVPRSYSRAVEIAAAAIQKAIDEDIVKQILEKQNETH